MNTSTIDTEEISFQIIACAGDALSKMHLALVYSKAQQFSEATRLMQEANASLNEGHNSHTRLLVAESEGFLCKLLPPTRPRTGFTHECSAGTHSFPGIYRNLSAPKRSPR